MQLQTTSVASHLMIFSTVCIFLVFFNGSGLKGLCCFLQFNQNIAKCVITNAKLISPAVKVVNFLHCLFLKIPVHLLTQLIAVDVLLIDFLLQMRLLAPCAYVSELMLKFLSKYRTFFSTQIFN